MKNNKLIFTATIFAIFVIVIIVAWKSVPTSPSNPNTPSIPKPPISKKNNSDIDDNKKTQKDIKSIAKQVEANELGNIPIFVYHLIGNKEGRWCRTPKNFRKDLQELYDRGYVLISLNDYLNGNIDIPAGKSPAIITFDDSTEGHFKLIKQDNGELKLDPNCAVGILKDFGKKHPEFGHVATFFINAKPFGQPEYWKQKVKLLDKWGFEIGNHTYGHKYLKGLSKQEISKQIVDLQNEINKVLPDYKPQAFSIVQDGVPNSIDTVLSGEYQGTKYSHKGILWWAWMYAESPYNKEYDPTHIQRIQVFQDNGKSSLVTWLDRISTKKYISDGENNTISIPTDWKEYIKDGLDRKIIEYNSKKTDRTPGQESKASEARGVHVTFSHASSENRWNKILDLAEKANLTSIQLDVKDESGRIGYKSNVQMAKETGSRTDYLPIKKRLNDLQERGIYSIARIVVFRDPYLAKQKPELMVKNSSGNPLGSGVWVDNYSKKVWDYNINLAIEAYELGFDEVQFDYNRFPEGWKARNAIYNSKGDDNRHRVDVIADFLKYAREKIGWNRILSATIFGFMAYAQDDQGIGQRPERMAPYLDYMSPMIYPSHFGPGNYGFSNPNAHPFGVINRSLSDFEALVETSGCKLRPWLQAFSWGQPSYNRDEIQAQINATEENDIKTWLLWDPSITYKSSEIKK